jgi:hypothetical protein
MAIVAVTSGSYNYVSTIRLQIHTIQEVSNTRLKMMNLFVAWYQQFLQLCIQHPLVNSHNTGGYLAGIFTLYKRVSNTRLKMM